MVKTFLLGGDFLKRKSLFFNGFLDFNISEKVQIFERVNDCTFLFIFNARYNGLPVCAMRERVNRY